MKEQKKVTLKTSYNTLLRHVWEMKKNSAELDKENTQLKSRLVWRQQTPQICRRKVKQEPANQHGLNPSKDLILKLQHLYEANSSYKEQIVAAEEEQKQIMKQISNTHKVEDRIKRMEKKVSKCCLKVKRRQFLKKKSYSPELSTESVGKLEQKIEKEEMRFQELSQKIENGQKQISKAKNMYKRLGKQIIELIDEKNALKKQIKSEIRFSTTANSKIRCP